ncbi:hypothetical protein INT43_001666 [Umbelopsis isabellina]|uniref:Ankyrin n=1 Tax=Mortierella isabellina TaxID=91625 RepID=A0A8H7UDD1_MORIS|nr:hypothetical protein INT43_001666 [Umbelopsis isabellina]
MPYTAPQLPATLFMSSAQRHAAQRHAPGHSLNQAASNESRTAEDRPLHKTLRTRTPKPQRSSMSLATTRMRDMFLNTKEREELFTLCAQGDVKKVRSLLELTTPKLVPDLIRDSKMRTPLLVACAAGQTEVVKALIEFGADPNCPHGDIVGNLPLDLAVISNNVDTVIALLDSGAKVSSRPHSDAEGTQDFSARRTIRRTPLHLAQSRLDLLIKHRQSLRMADHSEPGMRNMQSTNDGPMLRQVIQIIQILKTYMAKASSSSSTKDSQIDELDGLSQKLSNIAIQPQASHSATQDNNDQSELEILEGIRGIIEKLNL